MPILTTASIILPIPPSLPFSLSTDHYDLLKYRQYLSLSQARSKKLRIDFKLYPSPKPDMIGSVILDDILLEDVIPYIDWKPFFEVWQLRGKYPNRGFPKIFNDKMVGEEAKKLFDDAQIRLKDIIRNRSIKVRGILTILPANSNGDDIEVYTDESRTNIKTIFYGLRQQAEKDSDATDPYLCLSDFIAPRAASPNQLETESKFETIPDWIGLFAVSAGFGVEELCKDFDLSNDDYGIIMMKSLADRLAEASAEKLHEDVRKKWWGYSKEERDEKMSAQQLHAIEYKGIRPAPGYPSQPDHTEKLSMWELMKVKEKIGMSLTDSLAMMPAASVSGIYFANEKAEYFAVGKITKEQVVDYAKRKGMEVKEAEHWLSGNLAYDRLE